MKFDKKPPSVISTFVMLFAIGVVVIAAIVIPADIQCKNDIDAWLPLYPNAETISEEYDFIRPRGMGTTITIQTSTDELETIKQFYRDRVIYNLQSEIYQVLAATDWQVTVDENDSTINRIVLYSACGT